MVDKPSNDQNIGQLTSDGFFIRICSIVVVAGLEEPCQGVQDMKIALGLVLIIGFIHTERSRGQFAVDDELIEDIEDLLVYKEDLEENEEEEADCKDDSEKNFNDYDDSDFGIIPQSNKRFDSFFDQRAREKYLIKNLSPNMEESKKDEEYGKVKTKRNRESTLKQLIKLCKRSDEESDKPVTKEQKDYLRRVMQKFSTAPVYGKRFGSILEQQNRAKNLLKKVKESFNFF